MGPMYGLPYYERGIRAMYSEVTPYSGMANKQDYIAIMDDLLIHGFKGNHLDRLETLFKAMIKHGLKLSPKKC